MALDKYRDCETEADDAIMAANRELSESQWQLHNEMSQLARENFEAEVQCAVNRHRERC